MINVFNRVVSPIPKQELNFVNGKEYIYWGEQNRYPNYIYENYINSSLLQTIVDGMSQYICGYGVDGKLEDVDYNTLLNRCVKDRLLYGGFAIQLIYNPLGEIAELKHMPFERCRVTIDEQKVVFSKYFGTNKRYKGVSYYMYGGTPAKEVKTSEVLYYNQDSVDVYPNSPIHGCLKSIVTSIEIQNFHYNAILNNFAPSAIINFNNGQPSETEKQEIDTMLNECFAGTDNASKFIVTYNDSKESSVSIERLETDDFDKKYEALDKAVKENIFVAFRAQPILFGLDNEKTGFNKQEYLEAFELFNCTVIRSYQHEVINAFKRIGDDIKIKPFRLNDE